jgi:3',5'-cyclic AMP phosphodiesterase CpdA
LSVLLQISDTHFGTERHGVVQALVNFCHQQRPDLVVMSGDITQRAQANQFRAARAFVDRLGVEVLAIPGNHDIPLGNLWARLHHPYANHCAAFGPVLEPMHSSPELLVVCVNTTRWYRHKNGEVSAQQIDRVARRLRQATPAQLRVVVVHQPIAVTRASDSHDLLRRHAQAASHWAAAGADLVMGGHIHLPYIMPIASDVRRMWAVQAGTAVSSRVRGGTPNSVNLIRWGADAPDKDCVIEQWDCSPESLSFERRSAVVVRPDSMRNGLLAAV